MNKAALCRAVWGLAFSIVLLAHLSAATATAQETGSVEGTVTSAGSPVAGVHVVVQGTQLSAVTDPDGGYRLPRVPVGNQSLLFRRLGYQAVELGVSVTPGTRQTLDATMETQAVMMGDIIVEGASRAPERIVEAPAAVAIVEPQVMQSTSLTAQAPMAIATLPGMDVVQSGMNDFNINTRGFNSSLNRRILILQDGRDLALAFLGSQEWNAMSLPLEDVGSIEVVRGPGSALYGANAFSGVVNITTPLAREVVGTKVSLGGGELSTIRGDLRHAGLLSGSHFGYRMNLGFNQSDSWDISRTRFVGTRDIIREYGAATDVPVTASVSDAELVSMAGDPADPGTGGTLGTPDPVRNIYGSARFDYYADNGAVVSAEGGMARVENGVFVTGIGRIQVLEAIRPWARLSLASETYNLMAWYSGRNSLQPQVSLTSGLNLEERSDISHVEGQVNHELLDGQLRTVVGASFRNYKVDTEGTLMATINDARSDNYYSVFTQVEYEATPQLRFVGAARYDNGDLFSGQISPKAAVVFSPNDDHALRFTVNRAFQTPNYSEFFLNVPVAAPSTSPGALEAALEGYFAAVNTALGPAVADLALPTNLPWDFSALTGAFAFGNPNLEVETVVSFEVGYKGNLSDRVYVGVDLYLSQLDNFVTDLLPGINPAFPQYSLGDGGTDIAGTLATLDARLASLGLPIDHPLRANAAALNQSFAGLSALAGGVLGTMPDGSRAIIVSYGNAGEVEEKGIELSAGFVVSDEIRVSASYSFFNFNVTAGTQATGDRLVPNTPRHKGRISFDYSGAQGFDFGVQARFVESHDWAAGVFSGFIPSSQTVNVSLGYRINHHLRFSAIATNVLDQQRYHIYGGSVIGRRVLGGVTATF